MKIIRMLGTAMFAAIVSVATPVSASPMLEIVGEGPQYTPTGDPEGQFPWQLPESSPGNWTAGNTNGYLGNYLELVDPSVPAGVAVMAPVIFQFRGTGDASQTNMFVSLTAPGISWNNSTGLCNTENVNICDPSGNATLLLPVNQRIPFTLTAGTTPPYVIDNGLGTGNQATGPSMFLAVDDGFVSSGNVSRIGDPLNFPRTGTHGWIGLSDLVSETGNLQDAQDLVVRVTVPEPGTIALVGLGLFGLGAWRRRRTA